MMTHTARVFQALWKDQELRAPVLVDFIDRVVGKRTCRQEMDLWLTAMVNGLRLEFPCWLPDLDTDQVDWPRLTEFFCTCFYAWRSQRAFPTDPPAGYWQGDGPESGKAAPHPQRARAIFETVPVQMLPLEERLLALGGHHVVYLGETRLEALLALGQAFGGESRRVPGQPSQCHMNAADLWDAHREKLTIATGYALSRDGMWRQHSWNLRTHPTPRQRRLIETTERRERYFGYVLDEREAEGFLQDNGSGFPCEEYADI